MGQRYGGPASVGRRQDVSKGRDRRGGAQTGAAIGATAATAAAPGAFGGGRKFVQQVAEHDLNTDFHLDGARRAWKAASKPRKAGTIAAAGLAAASVGGAAGGGLGALIGRKQVAKGFQPRLARRMPAAGRNGKRLVTGTPAPRAVIGKGWPTVAGLKAVGGGAKQGVKTGMGGATPLSSPANKGARMGNTLGIAGGKAMGAMKAQPKLTAGAAGGGALAGWGVSKRRYDPEDERRHRQGLLAGTSIVGGGALAHSGGRQIVRDSRHRQAARDVLKPMPPTRDNGMTRGAGGKTRRMNPAEVAQAERAYGEQRHLYERQDKAFRQLKNTGGAIVRGRPAAKLAGGLALVGAGGALHSRRREPRWD